MSILDGMQLLRSQLCSKRKGAFPLSCGAASTRDLCARASTLFLAVAEPVFFFFSDAERAQQAFEAACGAGRVASAVGSIASYSIMAAKI